MTEKEAIEKIHSVYPTGCKNGLENMRALMGRLGNPQEKLTMVHVAGTNGKGSCCAMIERMLRAAGYKTGLYTSPYIEVYNERIRINGEPIAGDKLAALVESVWPAVEACEKDGVQITEFELGTALAFCCFAKEKVNVAVIEVGLGGRLDPTNIITPAVSVITEVGMDHMQFLGDTIEQIALEKAGIMKPGVPVVLGRQEKAARGVLLAAAKGKELPILSLTAENVKEERTRIAFDVAFGGERLKALTVSLCGRHQADNACAALGALLALKKKGMKIPTSAVRAGLADVHWPGRLEYFGRVLLDGAHNDPGVRALCGYLDRWMPKENTVLISAMMRDKETEKMCQRLAARVRCVVCTQPNIPRAMPAGELAKEFEAQGIRAYAFAHVKDALEEARRLAGPEGWVLGLDIQAQAVANTNARLAAAGLEAIGRAVQADHANLAAYLPAGGIDAAVFNFGYLPGADHHQFSTPATSLPALEAALAALRPGGLLAACLYSGGPNGDGEKKAVLAWLERLPLTRYTVLEARFANWAETAPLPCFVLKNP